MLKVTSLQVLHVCHALTTGGASQAVRQLNASLSLAGAKSQVLTGYNVMTENGSVVPRNELAVTRAQALAFLESKYSEVIRKDGDLGHRSLDLLGSITARKISSLNPTLVHLHYTSHGGISLRQISKICQPRVWTLHDSWAFGGGHHLINGNELGAWTSQPQDWRWYRNLEELTLALKRHYWKEPMQIVTPSAWMANLVRKSGLMGSWPIVVIPNAINTEVFSPRERVSTSHSPLYGDTHDGVILFATSESLHNHNKGFDLLLGALQTKHLRSEMFKIAVTAPRPPWADQPEFRNFVWIGRAKSAEHMSAIYNSVDAVVIPSRVESNSLVSMEAQACGKPVIGFRSSGFAETVIDGVTGFLADPYEITSLARAIRSALSLDRADTQLSCRARAEEVWSASVIAQRHIQVYEQTLMA